MDNLPAEILIEIFKFLPYKTLLSLTLVCTRFNDIISTCRDLSSRLPIHLRSYQEEFVDALVTTRRRPRTLIVQNFSSLAHFGAIESLSAHIQCLEIHRWNWSLSCNLFNELFVSLPHLTHVRFSKILLHCDTHITQSLATLPTLDSLEIIESDARVFRLFQNTQVRHLVYNYAPNGGNFAIPDALAFIERQESLTELTLIGFVGFLSAGFGRIIFHDSRLSRVKFRLEKLEIRDCPITPTRHFKNFLDLHALTLKSVTLDNLECWNCASFVDSCVQLEELTLGRRHASDGLAGSHTVTMLNVHGPVRSEFLGQFPNLRVLRVTNLKTERGKFTKTLGCEFVEEMTIEKSYLGGFFKMPRLRKLHLKSVRVVSGEIFVVNPQIREVVLENCDESVAESIMRKSSDQIRLTVMKK